MQQCAFFGSRNKGRKSRFNLQITCSKTHNFQSVSQLQLQVLGPGSDSRPTANTHMQQWQASKHLERDMAVRPIVQQMEWRWRDRHSQLSWWLFARSDFKLQSMGLWKARQKKLDLGRAPFPSHGALFHGSSLALTVTMSKASHALHYYGSQQVWYRRWGAEKLDWRFAWFRIRVGFSRSCWGTLTTCGTMVT